MSDDEDFFEPELPEGPPNCRAVPASETLYYEKVGLKLHSWAPEELMAWFREDDLKRGRPIFGPRSPGWVTAGSPSNDALLPLAEFATEWITGGVVVRRKNDGR